MDGGHDISDKSKETLPEESPPKELEQKVDKTIEGKSIKKHDKEPEPMVILEPHSRFVAMAAYTVNRVEPEKIEIPVIIDMKKAEDDYNSIDYMVIDFNRRNGYLHPSSVV
jgi:hypothetical protein